MEKPSPQMPPLRFVVLGDSSTFERWQAECLKEATAGGAAEIVGLVVRSAAGAPSPGSRWRKRWTNRRLALWRLFNRFYMRRYSKATEPEDLSFLFADVPQIVDTPIPQGKSGEALAERTIAFVRDLQPDFILRFTYGILRGEVLHSARYGVWSFHHGDPAEYRGQPPGFWEIANGSPTTGAMLQVLGDELDAGRILHQGSFQTLPQSYAKTRDRLYFGVSSWVRRTCADIQYNGWRQQVSGAGREAKGPIYKQPTNAAMLRFFWTTWRGFLRQQITYRLHRQHWNCAVIAEPIEVVAGLSGRERQRAALENAIWMSPPRGQFYADPFGSPLAGSGAIRLFFELFDWKTQRGEIATAMFDGRGFGPTTSALSAATHLSYPYVIEHEGSTFFVPEHAAARDVSAFRVDSDGNAVEKTTIFPRSDLIDTTFVEWAGLLWAFATNDADVANTHLYLFYSDLAGTTWREHPLNPVKTNIRSARPAGTPFVHEGKLYRPAQDCASHYGAAITVNEIITLSETDYAETEIGRVEPVSTGPYPYGLHTLSQVGKYTLIDGSLKMPRHH